LRVVIVDDHELFAEAIQAVLERHGIEVVGIALTGREGISLARFREPDVALVDVALPDMSGIMVGRRILEERPLVKIMALTALNDPASARQAIQAGFHGYVTKQIPLARLVDSIRAVADGQAVIPHRLAAAVAGARSSEEQRWDQLSGQLTARERQVLDLLVEGASSQDIARTMSIRSNTVRTHIQNILSKLEVHSRLEAAAYASRFGAGMVSASRRGSTKA
jgi:two-component system nitrate/nitrite response regulator NarL